MKKIKLVVFDIDGTLVPRGTTSIPNSAIRAINTLKTTGYEIMVATGRPFYFILDTVKEIIDPDYYVTVNGTCLLDWQGNFIEVYTLDIKTIQTLIALAKEYNFSLGLKYKDCLRIYNQYERFVSGYAGDNHPEFIPLLVEDFSEHYQKDLPLGAFFFADDVGLEAIRAALPNIPIAPAVKGAYDIYPEGIDKTKTIEHVLTKLNITWNEVMSFGDALNDVEMLQKAAIGVAMGNAPDDVKQHADYITSADVDDGIFNALKHFELI